MRAEVEVDLLVPVPDGVVLERELPLVFAAASVGDPDIEATMLIGRFGNQIVDGLVGRDVAHDRNGASRTRLDCVDGFGKLVFAARGHDHRGARIGETDGDTATNATACAGDNRGPAVDSKHVDEVQFRDRFGHQASCMGIGAGSRPTLPCLALARDDTVGGELNGTVASMGCRRHSGVAIVGAVSLLLAACSGSDSGSPVAPTTPAAAVEAVPTPEPLAPQEVVDKFVAAWEAHDWPAMDTLTNAADSAGLLQETHAGIYAELGVVGTELRAGEARVDGPGGAAMVEVTLQLEQLGEWTYDTEIALVASGNEWAIDWSPATLHPGLREGRSLTRLRLWPERGELLAHDGALLRTDVAVVRIGVQPGLIEDRDLLLPALERILGTDPARLEADIDAPGVQPDWFIPVETLRASSLEPVADELAELKGVILRNDRDRRGPTDGYARQALGTTGPITAEQLDTWGEPYDSSSVVGRSGLELVYEQALAGTPLGEIRLVDAGGSLLSVMTRFSGAAPLNVRTTLDVATQSAAELALDGVEEPAALVAIDTATGEIRAAVSRPVEEFGRALAGAYPPGSTFKTVTAAAFLSAGATPGSTVSCPATQVVTGLPFTNAGGSALGNVSLQTAFARSCNTAFVNVSTSLENGALVQAATSLGFNTEYEVGLNAVGGDIPEPVDAAESAASAIGQGRVTASPLQMASVAAAVADGSWRPPRLVISVGEDEVSLSGPGPIRIEADVLGGLQSLMRSVVTGGTGGALAGAGSNVSAKTGSAEFGDEEPRETHAWVIGYRDDLAFAVLVEGGGAGGAVAGPIAAAFLAAIDAASST